jgi:hypothetical protein
MPVTFYTSFNISTITYLLDFLVFKSQASIPRARSARTKSNIGVD